MYRIYNVLSLMVLVYSCKQSPCDTYMYVATCTYEIKLLGLEHEYRIHLHVCRLLGSVSSFTCTSIHVHVCVCTYMYMDVHEYSQCIGIVRRE